MLVNILKYFLIIFITLFLLEICYRFYVIDFYKSSWIGLNTPEDRKKTNIDLLVFGDSFSANNQGYISYLQSFFPDKSILNSSVSGIGIKQLNIMALRRLKETNPKNVLIQVFVGNDLLDVQNLTNWKNISLTRNIYWKTSNSFLSLRYLNQNFSFLKKSKQETSFQQEFSKDFYNERYKLYFKANNSFLYQTVTLENDFMLRYLEWKNKLIQVISKIPKETKVFVLFIPDGSQLNDHYFENMAQIGGKFKNKSLYQAINYPFFSKAKNDFTPFSNVEFLNPLEFLRIKDTDNYRLYFDNDPHFNKNGQKELSLFLKQKIFID